METCINSFNVTNLFFLANLFFFCYFFTSGYLSLTFLPWCFFCHFLRGLCGYAKSLQYSREFLMLLQDSDTEVVDSTLLIPSEIIWHCSFPGDLAQRSGSTVRFGNKRLWRTTVTWQRPNSDWVVGSVCISIKTSAALQWSGQRHIVLTLNFYLSFIFSMEASADIRHFSVHSSKGKCWHRHSDYCRYGTQATEHHTACTTLYFVTCPTRHMKCLDLCYGSIKGAYKSFGRGPLGMSNYRVVYLVLV